MTPAGWAAGTAVTILWYVLLALAAVAVLGMVLSGALDVIAAHRERYRQAVQQALALACPKCDADPARRCNCLADCGRRYCDWATVIDDGEFGRRLAELLESEGGNQ